MAEAIKHSLPRSKACREKSAEAKVSRWLQTPEEGLNSRKCHFQMETRHGIKYRQRHMEDYLRMVSAEQKEQAGRYANEKIIGNPDTNTDFWADSLLDTIFRSDNLNAAYKKVKASKGADGIDGMQVNRLLSFLRENQDTLIQKIRGGKFKPNSVRRVEIPKETKGEFQKLGVPTVSSYCTPPNDVFEGCPQLL